MSLRDSLLRILDSTRGISPALDFRRYDVTLRVSQFTGDRPGVGTTSFIDYPILVHKNINRPKVKLLTQDEIIASNGLYQQGDYQIGPVTPQYTDFDGSIYGNIPDDFDVLVDTNPQDIQFKMEGPGMTNGHWFNLIKVNFSRNLHYNFVIRRNATQS